MKFGQYMESHMYSPWRAHYVEYYGLKRLILKWSTTGEAVLGASKRFMELLEHQFQRVNSFAGSKVIEVQDQVVHCIAKVSCPELRNATNDQIEALLLGVESRLDALADTLILLDAYVSLNEEAIKKIVKKFDKYMGTKMKLFVQARLAGEVLVNLPISRLLVPLSECYTLIRNMRVSFESDSIDAKKTGTWKPPSAFQRTTTKYWVRPSELLRVKILVLKHLPILLFGSGKGISDMVGNSDTLMSSRKASIAHADSADITSIYFDSPGLLQYHTRLVRDEGATLVRIRWYGPSGHTIGNPTVFVERKTHHESWVEDGSVKERFPMKWNQVDDYIAGRILPDFSSLVASGEWTLSQKEEADALALETQALILKHGLVPMSRTAYQRCAFQLASTNDVRISIDSGMILVNEFRECTTLKYSPKAGWCAAVDTLDPTEFQEHVELGEIHEFPYGILEIKLQKEAPDWVSELLDSGVLVPVQKFSKFLTSCAFFHREQIRMWPHWFQEDGQMGRIEDETYEFGKLQPEPNDSHLIMDIFPSTSNASGQRSTDLSQPLLGDRVPIVEADQPVYQPLKIEPKTFFANERTFISWMHQAVFIMTLAFALYSIGDSGRKAALLLFGIALLFLVYALVIFQLRAKRIRQKSGAPYDDRIGPSVLVFVLLSAMIGNVIMTETDHRNSSWDRVPTSGIGLDLLVGSPTKPFGVLGSPSGGIAFHKTTGILYVPSYFTVHAFFLNGTSSPMHSFKMKSLINGITTGASDSLWLLSDERRALMNVNSTGHLMSTISLRHLYPPGIHSKAIGVTYSPRDEGIFLISMSSGDIVGISSGSASMVIVADYYLEDKSIITGVRALAYTDERLVILVEKENMLKSLSITNGTILGEQRVPGHIAGWAGIAIVKNYPIADENHELSTSPHMFLALESPPQIWKVELQKSSLVCHGH